MRIAFSECMPVYARYMFPYHVWGFLEEGESISDALASGFLPATYDMSRFYLTRSVRIALESFSDTGRTRYVRRRCEDISRALVDRHELRFDAILRDVADAYFANQTHSAEYRRKRFFEMIGSPFATHFMLFTDHQAAKPVGLVPLLLTGNVAEYGIPVYSMAYRTVEIGNHMMAETLRELRSQGRDHAYLGTCYSTGDLYKTRFLGMQFFNGYRWSGDRRELHFLIDRQQQADPEHVLGSPAYLDTFCGGDVSALPARSTLRLAYENAQPGLNGLPRPPMIPRSAARRPRTFRPAN